jgi:hypothetical protein
MIPSEFVDFESTEMTIGVTGFDDSDACERTEKAKTVNIAIRWSFFIFFANISNDLPRQAGARGASRRAEALAW